MGEERAGREEEKRRKDKVGTEGANVTKLTLPCMLCQYSTFLVKHDIHVDIFPNDHSKKSCEK